MNPNKTGPIKNPIKPIPETNEMLAEDEIPFVLPATRNNSGTITERPIPKTPKPKIAIENESTNMNT